METWIPVVVALIAAVASIFAASRSRSQATKAQKSAEMLDSRAHKIARIDREVEELREAYKAYALSMGEMHSPKDGGRVMAALEVLAACQATSVELIRATRNQGKEIAYSIASGQAGKLSMDEVRLAYMEIQFSLAQKRLKEATDR